MTFFLDKSRSGVACPMEVRLSVIGTSDLLHGWKWNCWLVHGDREIDEIQISFDDSLATNDHRSSE